MPSPRLFGVDLRLPSPTSERPPRHGKNISPFQSPANSRRGSLTHMDHIKRPSIAGLGKKHVSDKKDKDGDRSVSKDKHAKDTKSANAPRPKPVSLGMQIESPPVLFIGAPSQSSGALMSGRLQVTPNIPEAALESMTMWLECTTHTKRPVENRCRECQTQVTDLYEWHFFTHKKTFEAKKGMQELPFSHLIPGHLPATTHGQIGSIEYSLHVRAKSDDGQEIEYRRELMLQRALLPGNDKTSIRIFPPTNLTLNVTLPSIVHPIGEFPVICRMSGITTIKDNTQVRWKLRKLMWRIEENEAMISPACTRHSSKVGGEGKGVKHENNREIGMDDLKQGWKTDFSDGVIEGEFMASISPSSKPQCDVDAQNGLKISHNLVLELVIAEEWASNKKPDSATPTGAARVLRTQFSLSVTERAGMGITWEDEMPPMYENVPESPPHYQGEHTTVTDYDLQTDIDGLNLNS